MTRTTSRPTSAVARHLLHPLRSTSLVALAVLAPAAAAQRPTRQMREGREGYDLFVIPPFTPGGTAYSSAVSVNDLGQVTGMATSSSDQRAFLWTAQGGAIDLGEGPRAFASIGRDVSRLGLVAGSSDTAVLWTGVASLVSIPTPPGTYAPFAFGLNELERVVGQASLTPNLTTGWVWDPSLGTRDLRSLGVPGATSAVAINESNRIVGQRLTSNYKAYAFDLDVQALTDLGTFGGPTSEALGLNDLGHVVGWATNANHNTRPFLWTPSAGLQDLGSLGGQPYDFGKAHAINTAGQVVGYSSTGTGDYRAFLWDAQHGMRDLNTLVDDLGTFELVTAVRIGNTGWIVGDGRHSTPGSLPLGYVLRPR